MKVKFLKNINDLIWWFCFTFKINWRALAWEKFYIQNDDEFLVFLFNRIFFQSPKFFDFFKKNPTESRLPNLLPLRERPLWEDLGA